MSKLKLRKRWKKEAHDLEHRRRASVAFADYDIDSPSSSVSATCILLYGTAHVLCGTVLTLSDALSSSLKDSWLDHSSYLEAYLILEYLFSIVGIFILQILVILDERNFRRLCQKKEKLDKNENLMESNVSQKKSSIRRILSFFPGEKKFVKKRESPHELSKWKETPVETPMLPQPTVDSQLSSVFHSSEDDLPQPLYENHNQFMNSYSVTAPNEKQDPPTDPKNSNSSGSFSSSAGRRRKSGVYNCIPKHSDDTSAGVTPILISQAHFSTSILPGDMEQSKSESPPTHNICSENPYTKSTLPVHFLHSQLSHVGEREKHEEKLLFCPVGKCQLKPGEELERRVYRDREGVNLYLRLGAVAFGFGVMIHDGFKISDQINDSCRSNLWIPKFIIHLGYIFLQTYFIFKHHRMAFNWHCTLVRMILIHLATVNVVQWLKTIVFEISENMRRQQNHTIIYNNRSSEYVNTTAAVWSDEILFPVHPHHCSGLADKLSPFLFPCTIEYSLIAAAVCYKLFQKVGIDRFHAGNAVCHKIHLPKEINTSTDHGSNSDPIRSQHSECHRSHRGLFVGLLLVMVTMVAMGLFFFLQPNQQHALLAMTIYQMTEIFLQAITGSSCLFALYKMRVLGFRPLTEGEAFDDNLLLVGLCGTVTYNLFVLLPAVEYWNDEPLTARLYAVKSVLEISQALLQMFFIVEASRKCARTPHDADKKPGRSWVTFLLASNLAMWIVNTFEVKRADAYHGIQRSYYRELSWNIINFISLPLIIFFRFHSTVCLSDIWVKCYKLH